MGYSQYKKLKTVVKKFNLDAHIELLFAEVPCGIPLFSFMSRKPNHFCFFEVWCG